MVISKQNFSTESEVNISFTDDSQAQCTRKDIGMHNLQDSVLAGIYDDAREGSCFKLWPSKHCLWSAKKHSRVLAIKLGNKHSV